MDGSLLLGERGSNYEKSNLILTEEAYKQFVRRPAAFWNDFILCGDCVTAVNPV